MINVSTYTNVATSLLRVYQRYTKGIRFLLVMFLTLTVSANAWGAEYEKYSGTITEGDYLIVYSNGAMKNTVNSDRLQYSDVTVSNNKISNPDVSLIWHIAPSGNYWTIYNASVNKYAAGTGSKNKAQLLASGTDNKSLWTVSGTSTYEFVNKANKAASVNSNLRRNGTYGFACYATGTGGALTLYKKVTAVQTVAVTGVSLNQTSLTLTEGYSETLTATVSPDNATNKTVTWSTSDANIATVSNGKVTAVAEGTATVTVTTTDGGKTATCNVTVNPKPKYTVTLVPGSGSVTDTELEEPNAGEGVTLPTPTLDCGDWKFAGWKTTSAVTTETSTKPTLIAAGTYKPTANTTLYAVYQRTETTEGTPTTTNKKYTHTIAATTWSTNGAQTLNSISWTLDNNGSYYGYDGTKGQQVGSSGSPAKSMTLTTSGFASATKITAVRISTSGASSISGNVSVKVGSIAYTSGGSTTKSLTSTNTQYEFIGSSTGNITISWTQTSSKAIYFKTIEVDYQTTTAGGSTTTYYHSTPDCGTPTPTPTLNVDLATLTFEKTTTNTSTQKTFTLTGSNLTANASLQLSGINPGMFSLSSNSVTQSEGSINQTITVTYTPTATGSHNAILTISSTGAEGKEVTLSGTGVAPAAKYTVTFNAGSGSCSTTSLQETSSGAGVTLPTANPPATCATDGWKFAGWWTEAVAGTTTSPGELLTADSNYKPASDCTLYAVYSQEVGGGGSSSEITLLPSSFEDKGTNNYGSGVERTTTVNDVTFGGHYITGNQSNTPSGTTQNKYLQCRANDATIYNKTALPGKITQIVVNQYDAKAFSLYCGSTQLMESDNVDSSQTPSGTKITDVSAATTMTWNVDDDYTFFALKKGSNAGYVTSIVITYSGGGSTTTYNSNPVCVASWSITYDFAGGTGSHCSNTSVPQGDSYTICDEAPTREGHTFQGWSDGTSTYVAGATITPSSDVTLTAVWKANTYTVTWNNNGDTDEVTYNHGDALVVPTAPASCDGVKEFVGWTTHSGYYHATTAPDDIFTTKTTPVTATATYYAVFATPPTTGGGGGGSETTTTLDFTAQGYANAAAISNLTVNGITATFDKGSNSNAPKYYSTGTAIRAYGGNTITLSSTGTITNVTFTFSSGDDGNEITTNNGDGEWNEPTWTGNTTSNIVFTIGGASGHRNSGRVRIPGGNLHHPRYRRFPDPEGYPGGTVGQGRHCGRHRHAG